MHVASILVCLVASLAIAGCASPKRKEAVPPELTTQAIVPGLASVRYRVGIDTDYLRALFQTG